MARLNDHAYKILKKEIRKCSENDALGKLEQKMLLEELEKLKTSTNSSTPANLEDLKSLVSATYPNFSEKALLEAAKANRPLGVFGQIKLAVLGVIGVSILLVGGCGAIGLGLIIMLSNDSESVASKNSNSEDATSLSTEEHFEKATVLLEESEELVNKVATPADLVLSENKLKEAKIHLDKLPTSSTVTSLEKVYTQPSKRRKKRRSKNSYYYTTYTSSTPDEEVASLRSKYEQLEGKVIELKAGRTRDGKLITAAKQFAFAAATEGQNSPHSSDKWQQVESLWSQAIDRLQEIPVGNPDYVEAQKLLTTYQTNLGNVQTRRKVEQESKEALEQANSQIESLVASIPTDAKSVDHNRTISQIQGIINDLEKVQNGTTSYLKAQELLLQAKSKLNQLSSQLTQ
ncbi:MAG: hypothetical protein WBG73_12060 [Coleofasciculaceae cyanobacterium]